jgi:hypothetical protein
LAERSKPEPGSGRPGEPVESAPEWEALPLAAAGAAGAGPELLSAIRKALAADRSKSSAIVEALAEPIIVFSSEGLLEWRNAYAEFTFGAGSVVRGTPCHLLVCDEPEPCAQCPIAAFSAQERNPGTVRLRRDVRTSEGLPQPFELRIRRIQGGLGKPSVVVFLRDIGEESALELRMRQRLRRDDLRLELSDLLLSSTSLGGMLASFCDRAARAMDLCTVAVLLRLPDGWLVPYHVLQFGAGREETHRLIAGRNAGLKTALTTKKAQLVRDVEKSPAALSLTAVLEHAQRAGSGSMVIAPLVGRTGDALGALVVGRIEVDGFEQEEVDLVDALGVRLGLAVGGALTAEAGARATRLQKALLDQGELIASRPKDFALTTARMLEGITQGAGFPVSGAVLLDPRNGTAMLSHIYSAERGHKPLPDRAYALADLPFIASLSSLDDVLVVHPANLLPAERRDPIVARMVEEGERPLAFVPCRAEGQTLGWIVLCVPDPLWFSTPAELGVLRSLAQQVRIALSWVVADGRFPELIDDLQGIAPQRG